jgi:CBS domain-containing protein
MKNQHAIIVRVHTVKPEQTVQEALDLLRKFSIRCLPVVGGDKHYHGIFTFETVFRQLLPMAVRMEGGLDNVDFISGTAPGSAKRLRKIAQLKVGEVMLTETPRVHPDTPTWEMLRLLAKFGSPIPVVDEITEKFLGIVSDQSVLSSLEDVLIDVEAEEAERETTNSV